MARFVEYLDEQHEGVKKVSDINVWHLQQYESTCSKTLRRIACVARVR
jgi:hypothetical protein